MAAGCAFALSACIAVCMLRTAIATILYTAGHEHADVCTVADRVQFAMLAVLHDELMELGHVDAAAVVPLLQPSFRSQVVEFPDLVLLDVGANVGSTSSLFLHAFSTLPVLESARLSVTFSEEPALTSLRRIRVIAFEPSPTTFEVLRKRATAAGWADAGWTAFQVAVRHVSEPATIYSLAADGTDLRSSMSAAAATSLRVPEEMISASVSGLTIADAALPQNLNFSHVFILKIDVEGYDPHVLLGAKKLLEGKQVDWLIFEYHMQWTIIGEDEAAIDPEDSSSPSSNGNRGTALNSLRAVSTWLGRLGYVCYLITSKQLIPVYGSYWHEGMEIKYWANVLCGLAARGSSGLSPSPEVSSLVKFYNSGAGTIPGLHLPHC